MVFAYSLRECTTRDLEYELKRIPYVYTNLKAHINENELKLSALRFHGEIKLMVKKK